MWNDKDPVVFFERPVKISQKRRNKYSKSDRKQYLILFMILVTYSILLIFLKVSSGIENRSVSFFKIMNAFVFVLVIYIIKIRLVQSLYRLTPKKVYFHQHFLLIDNLKVEYTDIKRMEIVKISKTKFNLLVSTKENDFSMKVSNLIIIKKLSFFINNKYSWNRVMLLDKGRTLV
jgi:hypothetical protein